MARGNVFPVTTSTAEQTLSRPHECEINSRAWMRWVRCWAEAATRSPGCRVVLGGERFLLALVAVAGRHCGDGYLAPSQLYL